MTTNTKLATNVRLTTTLTFTVLECGDCGPRAALIFARHHGGNKQYIPTEGFFTKHARDRYYDSKSKTQV